MNLPGWKLLNDNIDRIIFGLLLVLVFCYLPLWVFGLVSGVGLIIFTSYYEVAVLLFSVELVFGIPTGSWSPYYFMGTIIALLGVLVAEELKLVLMVNR